MFLMVYIYIYIYIYLYISIWKPFNHVLYKEKIVLKTYLFCKIFGFLYRNFVSWFIPGRLVYSKHDIMFHLCIILHFIYLFQNSYFRMWCRKAKYCLQKKWTQKHFSEYLHNFLGCFPVNITFTICHFFIKPIPLFQIDLIFQWSL